MAGVLDRPFSDPQTTVCDPATPVLAACVNLAVGCSALSEVPMRWPAAFLIALLPFAASHGFAQRPVSPLLDLTKRYLAAAKARDAATVASFYAEDAVLMPPNAPPIQGRRAIQRDHERLFTESPPFELTATPLASETSGELGYIRGEYVVRRQGTPDVRGKYVEVWRRIDGQWKIICDINNGNQAPAPPQKQRPSKHRSPARPYHAARR
jgi:ketosteroid isomerase-like protein